ncbi:hypothetical protein PC121_g12056 [Phytophthora cactorum]|nr:hypothetical protein PC121_g12056 [Phytophthora cactorum]
MELDYFVTLPSGEERQLLQKVIAHDEPGRMVALVVTVMDAIALQRGGFSANCGKLGVDSVKMLDYFALIPGLLGRVQEQRVVCEESCGSGTSLTTLSKKQQLTPPASSHVNEKATSGSRNLMPSSYSPEALVSGQFGDIIAVISGDNTTDVTVAQYIEETYAFRPNRKYNFMVDLVVIWAWCSYLFTSHSSM